VRIPPVVLRTTLWLSLGGWVGAWAFFAFVVSRVAFRVLPGDVAGDLAGMLLQTLHFGGAALALVAAASAFGLGRRGMVVWLPVALAGICLASEIWLSPAVAAVRPSALGAASTAETSLRFSRLHGLSLGLFMFVHLASIGLVALNARLEDRPASLRPERASPP
jgi:hypothetical protein